MTVTEIAEGIVHWTGDHPTARFRVGAHFVPTAGLLIDPVLPDEGPDAIAAHGTPERIVLTNRLHLRSSVELAERFGCTIHVHRAGLHRFADDGTAVEAFDFGDEVAPGVTAVEVGVITPEEVALRIDVGDGALAVADGFVNTDDGVGFFGDELLGDDPESIKRGLRRVAGRLADEERFAHLLFAHGEPLLGEGPRALRALADGD